MRFSSGPPVWPHRHVRFSRFSTGLPSPCSALGPRPAPSPASVFRTLLPRGSLLSYEGPRPKGHLRSERLSSAPAPQLQTHTSNVFRHRLDLRHLSLSTAPPPALPVGFPDFIYTEYRPSSMEHTYLSRTRRRFSTPCFGPPPPTRIAVCKSHCRRLRKPPLS